MKAKKDKCIEEDSDELKTESGSEFKMSSRANTGRMSNMGSHRGPRTRTSMPAPKKRETLVSKSTSTFKTPTFEM